MFLCYQDTGYQFNIAFILRSHCNFVLGTPDKQERDLKNIPTNFQLFKKLKLWRIYTFCGHSCVACFFSCPERTILIDRKRIETGSVVKTNHIFIFVMLKKMRSLWNTFPLALFERINTATQSFFQIYSDSYCLPSGTSRYEMLSCFLLSLSKGLYSLSGKTFHRQILWSLEAVILDIVIIVSLWNLTGFSTAPLRRYLRHFRAIGKVEPRTSRLQVFMRSCGKTSYRLVNRGPVSL